MQLVIFLLDKPQEANGKYKNLVNCLCFLYIPCWALLNYPLCDSLDVKPILKVCDFCYTQKIVRVSVRGNSETLSR